MLKNTLNNQANVTFHTRVTINQTTGSNTHKIGLPIQSPESVNQPTAANDQKSNPATQTQMSNHIRIFPKNNENVISLGALSNIDISGFFWSRILNWEFQIGGIPHTFIDDSVIVRKI